MVEVQLSADAEKRYSWPLYVAGLRARLRCPCCVLVVTPRPEVAAWAAAPIDLGPGSRHVPFVLGPALVPVVDAPEQAAASPELAVLSVMAHGSTLPPDRAVALALSALAPLGGLDQRQAVLYYDLVVSSLSEAARRAFSDMDLSKYEWQSDFARRYFTEGREEGREEGRQEGRREGQALGRAESILKILESRGIPIPDDVRGRIATCRDLATLDRWVARAVAATSAADVVGA